MPVVGKTARVVEEVAIRKESNRADRNRAGYSPPRGGRGDPFDRTCKIGNHTVGRLALGRVGRTPSS